MTYKLHRNGVITGSLNSFCLACEVFLDCQQVADGHIETSGHKKKLEAVPYSDKFQLEHIKKFKGGYYCEFCNVLMPIASKVNVHITEDEHKHNKGILLLKPLGGDVVAFNHTVIEDKAWHGLVEGVCSLCNAEFEDENEHKADASHSLNLVLKPIQFGADNAIFRHLDDTAVQCLTCNKLLAPGRLIKHFDETEHQELYAKRRVTNVVDLENKENFQEIEAKATTQENEAQEKTTNGPSTTKNDDKSKTSKIDNDREKREKTPAKDKSKILESIARYQSKGININLETETAYCKKCSKTVAFDFLEIENHMENHSGAATDSDLLYPSTLDHNLNRVDINDKNTKSSDDKENTEDVNDFIKACRDKVQNGTSHEENNTSNGEETDTDSACPSDYIPSVKDFEKCSQEEEARNFAKANKITFNGGNNQSFCRVCKVHVPASFRSMKEHVDGANHKKNAGPTATVTKPKSPRYLAKMSTKDFVDSAYKVQGILYTASIINEEFCIFQNSFQLISTIGSRMRCILCEVNISPIMSDIEDHFQLRQHNMKWLAVPVITSEKDELIREVRPGLFHCGYCNLVVSGWTDMKQHLDCSQHRETRTTWERRLAFHMPNLRRFKFEEQMEAIAMMHLLGMIH